MDGGSDDWDGQIPEELQRQVDDLLPKPQGQRTRDFIENVYTNPPTPPGADDELLDMDMGTLFPSKGQNRDAANNSDRQQINQDIDPTIPNPPHVRWNDRQDSGSDYSDNGKGGGLRVVNDNRPVEQPINSATFREALRAGVSTETLEQIFNELNASKNGAAARFLGHYKQMVAEHEQLKRDYNALRSSGGELERVEDERRYRDEQEERHSQERRLLFAGGHQENAERLARLIAPDDEAEAKVLLKPHETAGVDWSPRSNDIYSDESYDPERRRNVEGSHGHDTRRGQSSEWFGNSKSREKLRTTPYPPPEQTHRSPGHLLRDSLDKPLPAIPTPTHAPDDHNGDRLASIQVLLRLLRIKLLINEQLTAPRLDKKLLPGLCESASAVCAFAEEMNASRAMQGRCAFYMGLAEFLRSKVGSSDGGEDAYAVAIASFENAATMCDEEFEEGGWGEEWAKALRLEREEPTCWRESYDDVKERGGPSSRTGTGEGVVDAVWNMIWGKSGSRKVNKDAEPSPPVNAHARNMLDQRFRHVADPRVLPKSAAGRRYHGYAQDQPQQSPRYYPTSPGYRGESERHLPHDVFGGMRPVADLGIRTDARGWGRQADNPFFSPDRTVISPEEDAKAFSPRRVADTVEKQWQEAAISPSPFTEAPPAFRGPSAPVVVSTQEPDLATAYLPTSPQFREAQQTDVREAANSATAPTGILGALGRRFSTLAVTPPATSPTAQPTSPLLKEEDEAETREASRSPSIADRRKSSIARLSKFVRPAS